MRVRSLTVAASGALAALLVLSACGGSEENSSAARSGTTSPSASVSTLPTPSVTKPELSLPPEPRVGMPQAAQCHRTSTSQLAVTVSTAPRVACDEPHTTVVAFVGLVRPAVTSETPQRRRVAVARQYCEPAFGRAVGGSPETRATTLLSWTMYNPDDEQLERGARWIRCDVFARSGRSLVPLPERLPLLGGGIPDALRVCQSADGVDVSCAQPHEFRVERVFRAPGDTYPGAGFRAAARDRCEELTGRKGLYWQPPSRAGWAAGDRFIRCLSRSG